ncbi:Ff.00g001580.m01.CDS01 [Fusarium sp. VM40]|nr:Ff.00g001580.m01.CDS01 [Fusarium sp. VM40]
MCFLFSVSYVFGVFFVSILGSKLLHLWTHFFTVPLTAFILYLPTFFLFDLLAICIGRLLLSQSRTPWAWIGSLFGSIVTLISIGGSASQLGFFVKTGGELDWRDATAYATSKEGLKVLFSGSEAVIACGIGLVIIAMPIHGIVYRAFGAFLGAIGENILSVYSYFRSLRMRIPGLQRGKYSALNNADADLESSTDTYSMDEDLRSSAETPSRLGGEKLASARGKIARFFSRVPFFSWLWKVALALFLGLTLILRPAKPYDFLSVTLPVSMLDVFAPEPDFCASQRELVMNNFPFPELLNASSWKQPEGDYSKGWAPLADKSMSPLAEAYRNQTVDWLPKEGQLPRGFFRYDPKRFKNGYHGSLADPSALITDHKCPQVTFAEKDPYYNPVNDPLKITNLDNDILPTLKEALGNGDVKIKHVVFILMESLRQDLWPLQQGSHTHSLIMDLNKSDKEKEDANERLSWMMPHIEKITGLSQGFTDKDGKPYAKPNYTWVDQAEEGFGGINVATAYTAATMSTKSYCANHCGAYPMPVEKFAEADSDSYQPCIPQILSMMNKVKENTSSSDADYRDLQWKTALFEAEIEQYDRQEKFDAKLGFEHIITKKELEADWRFNESDVLYHKINYFAYPEPILMPYLKDFIHNTTNNNQRMWLTHFTSTTHHAWGLPEGYPYHDYVSHTGMNSQHDNFNKYLNTIRYHDGWMASLMNLLDEQGISNETLVVFAGDHGHSFKDDAGKEGTYENQFISNYRVGLTFRHPHLPRVQYDANTTTISILPTILDLLINSGSLNDKDTHIASDLVQDYEGQSLIRPYKKSDGDRRAWTFSVVNSGAGMLGVTSADVPWRLVIPLNKVIEYRVTDAVNDPMELKPAAAWSPEELGPVVQTAFGDEAAAWAAEAIPIAQWWVLERQRLWRYHSLSS